MEWGGQDSSRLMLFPSTWVQLVVLKWKAACFRLPWAELVCVCVCVYALPKRLLMTQCASCLNKHSVLLFTRLLSLTLASQELRSPRLCSSPLYSTPHWSHTGVQMGINTNAAYECWQITYAHMAVWHWILNWDISVKNGLVLSTGYLSPSFPPRHCSLSFSLSLTTQLCFLLIYQVLFFFSLPPVTFCCWVYSHL